MDAKKLEILMTAVDLGSFSRAAEVVGYTQSGLTHLVDVLEREIGVHLIHRNHRGIALTEEGRELMPAIREFLRANANLENRIRAVAVKEPETIRIAAYSSIAMHWMPEILYRFRRKLPEVAVDLRMVDHALEPFELLGAGKTDVIFASRQDYAFCDFTPLYREKMLAVLPKTYPLGGRETFPLTEFAGKEFLMPYGRFDLDVQAAMSRVNIRLQAKPLHVDDETLIRMVGKGLGVSLMSELMIRGRTDDVVCVPVEPEASRELGMGLLHAAAVPPCIRTLQACVLEFIGEVG